jgi:hypothetical protein
MGRSLVVPSGNPPPPFQAAQTPLHPTPQGIPGGVILRWPAPLLPLLLPVRSLVLSLRDHPRDPAPPQPRSALPRAVALIQVFALRPLPRAPSAGSFHGDGVQRGLHHHAVVHGARGQHEGQGATLPVAVQVDLGRRPAPAPTDPLRCRIAPGRGLRLGRLRRGGRGYNLGRPRLSAEIASFPPPFGSSPSRAASADG